jgi:hypothetical protein
VVCRVKLPKTFLAVNLSDAFTFQEKQHQNDNEALEMKPIAHGELTGPLEPGEPVEAVTDSATGETVSDTPTPAEPTAEAPVDAPTMAATTVATADVPVPETITLDAPTEEAVGGAGGEKPMD